MSTRRQASIANKLERVAEQLLDEMLKESSEMPFDQRLDALKVLSNYHLGVERQSDKGSKQEDEPGGPTFAEWRKRANGGERPDA
jgi:hypothetical protein